MITVNERDKDRLRPLVGLRRIHQFIESLLRPHILGKDLDLAYQRMAQDEARKAEALAWAEATVGDVADETR
jgi:hypothetical protein